MVQQDIQEEKDFIFREVHTVNNSQGEIKAQITFELGEWDTSKMDGYKEGSPVFKGFNFSIRTLKPDKTYPRQRVDLDIGDDVIRALLMKAITEYEKAISK